MTDEGLVSDAKIIGWLSGIIGVLSERISINSRGDVWVDDSYRLGWFNRDNLCLHRENPVSRALGRTGMSVKEGCVGQHSEPQYDMRIAFNVDGSIGHISDQRSMMEADWLKKIKEAQN